MDRIALAQQLDTSFNALTMLVASCSDQDFNTSPFVATWSPAQVAAHVVLATERLPDTNTRATTRWHDEYAEQLQMQFLNFDTKMKSPKVLLPGSKPYYKSNLLIQLIANRDHLKSIALEKEMEALCLDFEFPTIGYLTRYEWLAFIVAHVKRHTHQLEAMAHNNLQQQTTNSGI